jgi:hypothetical protein
MAQVGTGPLRGTDDGQETSDTDDGALDGGPGIGEGAPGLVERCRHLLETHWRDPGFTVPNDDVYPWQWLWDSCFHAVAWAQVGHGDRAVAELESAFAHQGDTGFVAHMTYWGAPETATSFWGRSRTSSITQPPMYGHALAELQRLGVDVPEPLVEAAHGGLRHLLSWRARVGDLVCVVHPWETGCDDSPRWDHWADGEWEWARWKRRKGELVASIERLPGGVPVANPDLRVAPAGFNALLAWNASELAGLTGDDGLRDAADSLAGALAERWDPDLATWVDAGDSAADSGRVRTADALLGTLVVTDAAQLDAARRALVDPDGLGAAYGPLGVDRREPTYRPGTYWRGPAWPQLTYLLWRALLRVPTPERAGPHRASPEPASPAAAALGRSLVQGAIRSGFAEFWDGDDATAGGAVPQSWSTLCAAVAPDGTVRSGAHP